MIAANQSRACVKRPGANFGNEQIFDMGNFDEMSRRIQWSKDESSRRLVTEPTPVGAVSSALRFTVFVPARFFSLGGSEYV